MPSRVQILSRLIVIDVHRLPFVNPAKRPIYAARHEKSASQPTVPQEPIIWVNFSVMARHAAISGATIAASPVCTPIVLLGSASKRLPLPDPDKFADVSTFLSKPPIVVVR